LSFNKIRLSLSVTRILSIIKGKTGLTPNIICRMALCLSISDPSLPSSKITDSSGQEFNRFTLLGEMDSFFISILKERLMKDKLNSESDLLNQFRAHLERGIHMIHSRIKDLTDVYDLIPYQNNNHNQQEKKDFQSKKID
jgi:DNA sulfur modification protein DndE